MSWILPLVPEWLQMSTGSHCKVRSRMMNVVSRSLYYWKYWLFPSYSLVPMDRVMEILTVSSNSATATLHVYDKTFSLCGNLLSNLHSGSLKSSCTYFSHILSTFTDIPEVSTLQVETYSRTCNQPFLTITTNHCTLHSEMCQSRSKHSHDANPILTTLWIMWLLPTSSSIPKLFVFLGFYPKWQIGAALSSSSLWDRAWRSSSLPMHDSYLGLSKTPRVWQGCLVSGSALCRSVCLR